MSDEGTEGDAMKVWMKLGIGVLCAAAIGPVALMATPKAYAPGNPMCPTCYFDTSTNTLYGSIVATNPDHSYPLTKMSLKLKNGSTQETHSDLGPASQEGNTSITQGIDTALTGITSAELSWKCADSPPHIVTEEIDLQ